MAGMTRSRDNALDTSPEIAIVGAGIVGLALAVQLQLAGRRIILFDPNEPASGPSFGNAGYLSEGSIFPPASPDVLRRLPSLLLDPTGPLVVRSSYLPHLIPWGIRLIAAMRPKRQVKIVEALSSLNREAIASYRPLLAAAGAEALIDVKGSLVVCRYVQTLEQKVTSIPVLRSDGVRVERIGREETLRLEPALSLDIAGAIFFPENARCVSPGALGKRFADSVLADGVWAMKQRRRIYYSAAQRSEIWDRWQAGEPMSSIGRRFDRESSSVFSVISPTGGIRPPARRRAREAVSLTEREEISRGLSIQCSLRLIARQLGRSASTISHEVSRNGGSDRYRASGSDQAAWDRARSQAVQAGLPSVPEPDSIDQAAAAMVTGTNCWLAQTHISGGTAKSGVTRDDLSQPVHSGAWGVEKRTA